MDAPERVRAPRAMMMRERRWIALWRESEVTVMDESRSGSGVQCPTCGSPALAGTAYCHTCGTLLSATAPAPGTDDAALASRFSAPLPSVRADSSAERRCEWCGAMTAIAADRCEHCGAVFPRPEQDEALTRAAEERMRDAQTTIELMQRQRERRGWRRLLGR